MKMIEVSVIMGSNSDLECMNQATAMLKEFGIGYEVRILSAHRTPEQTLAYAREARGRGIKVIIAGAGGAAHLAGVIASSTTLPVIGVPIQSKALNGLDSLLSIVQMPGGIPVATTAIGNAGAKNAAILAVEMMAIYDTKLATKLDTFRKEQEDKILAMSNVEVCE
ncbi:MAG: 5-(carboxyamino)imidazole ribonucleotide mutase [Erysipelotrichaceae bacterium]